MTESTEVVKYQPNAAVGSVGNLRQLLQRNESQLLSVLPKHVTPDRIVKTMLVAVNRNQALLKCTQSSVFETISRAAELGLDLSGTLGEAYPVPYGATCQLIVGYRGLAKLARQSGDVSRLEAEVVREHDVFVYRKGSDFKLDFAPKLDGDRGKILGFYAYCKFKDGSEQADYMTVEEVNKIRARSKASGSGPWVTDFEEMGKKTVFRRMSKWMPLSAEKADLFNRALEADQDIEFESPLKVEIKESKSVEEALDELASTPIVEGEIVDEPMQSYIVPVEALQTAAKKKFGKRGEAMIQGYLDKRLGGKSLETLTEEETLDLDAFIAEYEAES